MEEFIITFGTLNDDDIQSGCDDSGQQEYYLGHPAAADESGSHRLQSTWRIWYSEKATETTKAGSWRRLPCFSTVEGFWSQFAFLKESSALPDGVSLFILRESDGCQLSKEMPSFSRWETSLKRTGSDSVSIDDLWKHVPFLVIGEAFNSPHIVGASLLSSATAATIQILTNRDDMDQFPELETQMRATIEDQLLKQIELPQGSRMEDKLSFHFVSAQ